MSNDKQNLGTIGIVNHKIENVEYVFQFNNDEPIHLASSSCTDRGNKELQLTIYNTTHSNVVFYDGKGNTFKIFAREKQTHNEQR
jgi:hypothetical protein